MNKKLKVGIILLVVLVIVGVLVWLIKFYKSSESPKTQNPGVITPTGVDSNNSFRMSLVKLSNKKENFLVSPYSVEVALGMLKNGASGLTKSEIEKVVPSRDLKVENENVKIANAIFIKDYYEDVIEEPFKKILTDNYNSEVLVDEFKTPDVINNWVDINTDGMIKKVVDSVDDNFVLGLINAIAIDANWSIPFECIRTSSYTFTKENGEELSVEMMNNQYTDTAKYLDSNTKGVILPYKEGLEFIALLPEKDLYNYVNSLNEEELNRTLDSFKEATSDIRLSLDLPRFKYSYDLNNFKDILVSMGIKSVFDNEKADLTPIITRKNMNKKGIKNIYVSSAVHKTYIDLNEKGTKAAAVTYFDVNGITSVAPEEYKTVRIIFDKPFIYMIRDIESKEILFFGTVYEPNEWKGSTCENKR